MDKGKPFIFVSCGQVTPEERELGAQIVRLIKEVTGLDAFFADDVHDLTGLDENILQALHDCVAFVTVLHPRGDIIRPSGTHHVRASVWIEQEIAIATYIQRVEKRSLPVIPFIHKNVGREGLRDLLHLNPFVFSTNSEVLNKLPGLLKPLKGFSTAVRVELFASDRNYEDEHWTRWLTLKIVNDTNNVIADLNCKVVIPAGLLKHWTTLYTAEAKSDDPSVRVFRTDLSSYGAIHPRSTEELIKFQMCTQCASIFTGEDEHIGGRIVGGLLVEATVWMSGREYNVSNTVEELCKAAENKHR